MTINKSSLRLISNGQIRKCNLLLFNGSNRTPFSSQSRTLVIEPRRQDHDSALNVLNHSSILYFQKRSFACSQVYASSASQSDQAKLEFVNGLIKLTIFLPAKQEKCEFTLKLYNDTVGILTDNIKAEDKSIEKAHIYATDGTRIAQNTLVSHIITKPFKIRINDTYYDLEPPKEIMLNQEMLDAQSQKSLDELKQLVSQLYLHLNVNQYEIEREQNVIKQLESLKNELQPMEKVKEELALKAKKHTNRMIWLGLGLMSVQAGIMARLTWFDYSWDIVEPISYFVSYSAVIGVYAYFVLTRKEYDYESASDRIFLRHFHKNAVRQNLNVKRYNELKDTIYSLESDLKRIRESQSKENKPL